MCCRRRFFLQCFSVRDPEARVHCTKKTKCKRSTVHHPTSRVAPNSDTTISVKEFDDVSDRSLLPDFSSSDHEKEHEEEEVADAEHSLERLKLMLQRPYVLTAREEDAEHSLDRLKSMLAKPCRLEPIMEEEHSLDRLKSMLAKPCRLEPIMEEAEELAH